VYVKYYSNSGFLDVDGSSIRCVKLMLVLQTLLGIIIISLAPHIAIGSKALNNNPKRPNSVENQKGR